MKKILMFFTGVLLLVLVFGAIFLTGAIYDAGQRRVVDTYFFRPNNLSTDRPGELETASELGDTRMINMLISHYISEYFSVLPDGEYVQTHSAANGMLANTSSKNVFSYWKSSIAPEIQNMATKGMMRTVNVVGDITRPGNGDYWRADYELRTWQTPNNLATGPVVTKGTMFLRVSYEPGIRESVIKYGVRRRLSGGADPAGLFKFRVEEVVLK